MIMIKTLDQVPLFRSLDEETLKWLEKLTRWRDHSKGDYLFHEGESPASLYIVANGTVKVVKEFPSGKNAILGMFGPGELIAEIVAVDGKAYPASAVAHTDVRVGIVASADFIELMQRAPNASLSLIRVLGAKLRELTGNLGSMAVQSVTQRLARFLAKMADQSGQTNGDDIIVTLPMTRRDLAEIIGTSFEVVERSLKKMREENIISVDGKRIIIHQRKQLGDIFSE